MPQENRRIAIWIGCVLAAWTVWILSWFGVVPDFGGALPVLAFMGLMLCGHAATLWIMADTLRQPPRPKLRDARAAPQAESWTKRLGLHVRLNLFVLILVVVLFPVVWAFAYGMTWVMGQLPVALMRCYAILVLGIGIGGMISRLLRVRMRLRGVGRARFGLQIVGIEPVPPMAHRHQGGDQQHGGDIALVPVQIGDKIEALFGRRLRGHGNPGRDSGSAGAAGWRAGRRQNQPSPVTGRNNLFCGRRNDAFSALRGTAGGAATFRRDALAILNIPATIVAGIFYDKDPIEPRSEKEGQHHHRGNRQHVKLFHQ